VEEERHLEPEPGYGPERPDPDALEPVASRRVERRPRTARRRLVPLAAGLLLLLVAFIVGLVVGRALEDAPRPGGEQTLVRTLVPSTLRPAEVVTVTVTEPAP
jgi:hypothetical protein